MGGRRICSVVAVEQTRHDSSRKGFQGWSRRAWTATLFASFLGAFLLHSGPSAAGGGPRNVLLVINRSSDISRDVGTYYQNARGIPRRNVCYINCSSQEVVSKEEAENGIREPIRQFILTNGLEDSIDYIVLAKGVPLAANYGDSTGPYSITSILTCVTEPYYNYYGPSDPRTTAPLVNPYGPIATSFWGQPAPEAAWSHNPGFRVPGTNPPVYRKFYLVTRLDGYSADVIKAAIDRGMAPALGGKFVLDGKTGTKFMYAIMNNRLGEAATMLSQNGHDTVHDNSDLFLGNLHGLMGYFSWGSNEWSYQWHLYMSNIFVGGGIADSYVSFSSRTFNPPENWPNYSGQSLIADLFLCGLCGAAGYVSEPYGSLTTYPTVLFDRYTKGYNMAESFYAASPELFWKTTVVGDPLMAPFSNPPIVAFSDPEAVLTGVATIAVEACGLRPIARVDFYFDDVLLGSDTQPPYELQIDTREYAVGTHTVEAIAYENSPVATQGSATTTIYVQNEVSNLSHISQALEYADGQICHITDVVVTASLAGTAGAMYIEEPDRSAGLRIIGFSQAVPEGAVVDVQGPVFMVNGEKTMVAPSVVITGSAQVPSPLTMTCATLCCGSSDAGGRTGVRSTGLLVNVIGHVVAADSIGFVLVDGAAGSRVRVNCAEAVSVSAGQWVSVVGIASVPDASVGACGQLLARRASDIVVIPR